MAMVEDYIMMVTVMMGGERRVDMDKTMAEVGRVGESLAEMVLAMVKIIATWYELW